MGFPVGYTEIFLPKLFVQTLSVLGFLRTIVDFLFRHLHLSDYLESDPDRSDYSIHPTRIPDSALLIREILPVIKFKELNLNLNHIGDLPENCSVCLYEFEDEQEIRCLSNCKHIFHRNCLDRWINHDQKTCPLCRTYFVPDEMRDGFNQRLWIASDVSDFTVPVPEL